MNTRDLVLRFSASEAVAELSQALSSGSRKLHLQGLCGSGGAMTVASQFAQQASPVLVLLPSKEEAVYFKADLENLLAPQPVHFLPESYLKPYQSLRENASAVQERIETLSALRKLEHPILVTYTAAIAEYVVDREDLESQSFEVSKGQRLDIDFLLEFLQECGFERCDFVFEPGQFSWRGGIIDLFSYAHEFPFRIELDGDIIESIRSFDVNDQRSIKEIGFFSLVPDVNKQEQSKPQASLLDYFGKEACCYSIDLELQIEALAKGWEKALQLHQSAIDLKYEDIPSHPKELWQTPMSLLKQIEALKQIWLGGTRPSRWTSISFHQEPQPLFSRNMEGLKSWLQSQRDSGHETFVFSENNRQIERLASLLNEANYELFQPVYVGLSAGFVDQDLGLSLLTEHQLFDKYYRPRGRQKFSSSTSLTLRDLKSLKPGDFVTHIDHGIGRFAGLEKMEIAGVIQEVVRLVYKDNDLLYVSVNSLHKISKFSGKDGTAPSMHKLGSGAWEKQKRSTKKKVKDIARELIALYAQRKAQKGYSFGPDNYLQMELEASFFFEDTPDQAKAIDDVKRDMEREQPMDRLVCGDVGFGKTEVAMRAAFKAVCDSKQVAVLVPTTILAQQHYRSFVKRFKGFPVQVDYLNRFKSAKEQKATLENVKNGQVDVLIGTHRILAKDIEFNDLGLMIIDEEQKFGVSAKEKLKAMRVNVDSLTLTATPIPRTLHFSLMGARDLSVINTPPPNRQPVHTELHTFSKDLLAEAIQHELDRGGQTFVVHSRVRDIHEIAHLIEDAVDGVRVAVAHGQMEGHALEDIMVGFIEGEYDVLVATTIIESGLDIPNANTIMINNAHMFGLSDLHQMRGRVGRSNVKAFCYLMSPPLVGLPEDSRKRLRTLEEYSELGSGFQVAMRDLDIRGAGNLLGAEQSGFISEMGFDMYHKILDEAVRELKHEEFAQLFDSKEEDIQSRDCQIDTQFEMLIPSDYVPQTAERLSLYSELSNVNTEVELTEFAAQLKDRFGRLPEPVLALLDTVRLKWAGKRLGLEKISLINGKMRCFFPQDPLAAVYQSEAFISLMGFVAQHAQKFNAKQTDKAFIVEALGVNTVFEALYVLGDWDVFRKG